MPSTVRQLFKPAPQRLNIIEEFATLSPNRKIVLCDQLFNKGYDAFSKAVLLIWSNAQDQDVKKLEKFLILLKKTAH